MCIMKSQENTYQRHTTEDQNVPTEDNSDQYWNYKNGEFFIDSIFALSTVFEDFGDGLGMYIVCKILLPFFHGLRHSNYSCSIHRLIVRILCLSSQREGMKIIHERFYNREGKLGCRMYSKVRFTCGSKKGRLCSYSKNGEPWGKSLELTIKQIKLRF